VSGGSPCLVLVGGSRLSLRGEQAMQILVRPLAASLAVSPTFRPSLGECV
jgi:hypothetical protein